jgi:hypothetical protein
VDSGPDAASVIESVMMDGFILNDAGLPEKPGYQRRHLMRAKVFVACTKTSYEYYNKWRQYHGQFQDLGWSAPDDSILCAMEYGPLTQREVEDVRGRLQLESAKCTRCNRRIRPSHNRPVPYTPNAVIPDAWNEVINAPNAVRDMSNEGPEPPAVPEPVANESSNSDDDDKYYNGESSDSEDDEMAAAIGEGEESGISREECEE